MSSIKGEAHNLIKNLTLNEANFDVAVKKLKDKYLNPQAVKHTLLQGILNFKCDSKQLGKVESAVNSLSNDLEELKNSHALDISLELCSEFLREILFYRLPADVRLGLIDELDTNYPSFSDILAKLNKVITKIKIGRDIHDSKTVSQNPKVSNTASGDQSDQTK